MLKYEQTPNGCQCLRGSIVGFDNMIDWIKNKLNRYNAKSDATLLNRRVGFIEEKPNVWRVVYIDKEAKNG